ncbi:hypothetical protein C1645_880441 [Glomus cerebriforme]|uniref:BTB domain-containing protein n=1 Tax=Glomus cerebriforme TaxID=658196 RepID=A0A397SF82_9GLOM|nr:hypothetical protein C1645_880441 [Glomus cerebriforme]
MDDNKLLPKLSQNLLKILSDEEYYDITIKNDGTLAHIKLPEILPEIFPIILRYIYIGRLFLEEYDISDNINILDAAKLFSDPTSFSKDDIDTLKNTLQQLIPFIRFYNLTSKEFSKEFSKYFLTWKFYLRIYM